MDSYICTACGTQYPPASAPPERCPICSDERQYVPPAGQGWTTPGVLARSHVNGFRRYEPGLYGVAPTPHFGIGQRALLVRDGSGFLLWDCVSLVDAATVDLIQGLGGLTGIAISHPHYYTSMVDWSRAFGGVPIHLHAADRQWIMHPDPAVTLWEGERKPLGENLTLLRLGGHYPGGTVLHWAAGAGALLTGDILQVVADRASVSVMRSYPNFIPLGPRVASRIATQLEPWSFDVVYGAFWDSVIASGGKAAVERSLARYLAWVRDENPE